MKLRSNVYPNQRPYLKQLPAELRGAAALKVYVRSTEKNMTFELAVRRLLRPWQQAELAYELGCSKCGALPEGRVRSGQHWEIQFRCPKGICAGKNRFARSINLEVRRLEQFQSKYGPDISDAIQRGLYLYGEQVDPERLEMPYVQLPVRLSLTHHYCWRYEALPAFSEIVNACLRKLWEELHG